MFTICLHRLLVYRLRQCLFWFCEMYFINSREILCCVCCGFSVVVCLIVCLCVLIRPWTMQHMLLFVHPYTKNIYLSCEWQNIPAFLQRLRAGMEKEVCFIWCLYKHLSFPDDINAKWVKGVMVAPDAHSDTRDWLGNA